MFRNIAKRLIVPLVTATTILHNKSYCSDEVLNSLKHKLIMHKNNARENNDDFKHIKFTGNIKIVNLNLYCHLFKMAQNDNEFIDGIILVSEFTIPTKHYTPGYIYEYYDRERGIIHVDSYALSIATMKDLEYNFNIENTNEFKSQTKMQHIYVKNQNNYELLAVVVQ